MRTCVAILVAAVVLGAAVCLAAPIDFSRFHTPSSLASDLADLVAVHPTISQLFTIGTSVEGRAIQGIKISSNPALDDPTKGDVVFVGLHHAREWIAAEMSLYLAEYLLT